MEAGINPTVFIGLIIVGVAVLWARRLSYVPGYSQRYDVALTVLGLLGWLMVLIGALGSLAFLSMPWGWLLLPAVPFFALSGALRLRDAESRGIAAVVAQTMRRGLPLAEVLRAYAADCSLEMGQRLQQAADSLERGMPVWMALSWNHVPVPRDVQAMLAFMEAGTSRDSTLQQIMDAASKPPPHSQAAIEKFYYLWVIVLVQFAVFAFFLVKIYPALGELMQEFGVSPHDSGGLLSIAAIWLDRWSKLIDTGVWFLLVLFFLALAVRLVLSILLRNGIVPPDLPLVGKWSIRLYWPTALRLLAQAVEQSLPMHRVFATLHRTFPHRQIRRRFGRALRMVNDGIHWGDSLGRVRLLNRADVELLKSAERAGNVGWALKQLADSVERSERYRASLLLSLSYPLAILMFGLIALSMACSTFVLIYTTVHALSG